MNNGKMMSGEWKLPDLSNNLGTIRINPENGDLEKNTIQLLIGAKDGIKKLLNK